MNVKTVLLSALLVAGLSANAAQAQSTIARPATLLFGFANRIVGHWQGQTTIGACAGGPTQTFNVLGAFNAGGTLGYTTSMPSASASPTFGSWGYFIDLATHSLKFRARMQFFRYNPDGSPDGLQDIHRTITLSSDGQRTTENVTAEIINNDGSVRVRLCGTSTGQRVAID